MNEYDLDLYCHALNYRTAHTADAERYWKELESCVERLIAKQDKTCQHCKYWMEKKYPSGFVYAECKNQTVTSMIQAATFEDFSPPADFGCNRWEAK